MMSRKSLLVAMLFIVGFAGLLRYSYLIRSEDTAEMNSTTKNAALSRQPTAIDATPIVSVHSESGSAETVSYEDMVGQWVADAFDTDPSKRAKAITALATAPKSQAVPVLQKVLNMGETADRPLALYSLRTIALQQGDVDGGIRDVFRQAIYDGRYEAITPDAQTALDDVESYLDQVRPDASR